MVLLLARDFHRASFFFLSFTPSPLHKSSLTFLSQQFTVDRERRKPEKKGKEKTNEEIEREYKNRRMQQLYYIIRR